MSLVYSPQLGRYINILSSRKASIQAVYGRRALISPLVAEGSLIDFTFPLSTEVGVDYPWSCVVENVGTDGIIAFGIASSSANPGNAVITWGEKETVLDPVEPEVSLWLVYTTNPVPPGYRLITNGSIRFMSEGSYTIRLMALHEDAGAWLYDNDVPLTVSVVAPFWPVVKALHVFDHTKLYCNLLETWAGRTHDILTDVSVLQGGRIRYAITYVSGNMVWPHPVGYIYWNDDLLVEVDWRGEPDKGIGITYEGVLDLPQTFEKNTLKIVMRSSLGGAGTVEFDVWTDLGYSEEPPKPPTSTDGGLREWWEGLSLFDKAMISGVGLGVVYIVVVKPKMPAMPTVVTVPYPVWREREKEEG